VSTTHLDLPHMKEKGQRNNVQWKGSAGTSLSQNALRLTVKAHNTFVFESHLDALFGLSQIYPLLPSFCP